jgi:hypothetical protein
MSMPTEQQIRWLADTMAARMLVDAADHPRAAQLQDALRHWLPADEVTHMQLIEIMKQVQAEWRNLAAATDARLMARIERGTAAPLAGCEGRI